MAVTILRVPSHLSFRIHHGLCFLTCDVNKTSRNESALQHISLHKAFSSPSKEIINTSRGCKKVLAIDYKVYCW
jgi:hypothetical protein